MSESLNRLERWERRLKAVFDEINDELESTYGNNKRFRRHPNRPPTGTTSNREDDGLKRLILVYIFNKQWFPADQHPSVSRFPHAGFFVWMQFRYRMAQ